VLAAVEQTSPVMGVGYTLVGVAAATIVIAAAVRPLGSAVWALSWYPLRWVGQRSYGVYLYHPLCVALLAPRLGDDGPVIFLGTLIVSLCAAAASYQYVETPFLRLKERAKVRHGAGRSTPEGATVESAAAPTAG
jgi:peptidoglycan/LPS O-acetylase OafA/YrhL